MISYYLGVWHNRPSGHFCYVPGGDFPDWGAPKSPWGTDRDPIADGAITNSLLPRDLPERRQPEGIRAHHQKDGWTLVGWWDRSADERFGSVSVFAFDALLSADDAENEARRLYPGIFRRMDLHLGRTTQGTAIKDRVLERLQTATEQEWRKVAAALGMNPGP